MHNFKALALTGCFIIAGAVQAQTPAGGAKIVCWKDKAGKTVGCGDKVPPEYQDNATKQLNTRGITVNQSDPALTAEQKKALQLEAERIAADKALAAEQKRRDKALLDTFSSVNEIDLKRKRDTTLIESNIEAQQTNLKNANDRQADARTRMESFKKENKPVPAPLQEEYDRADAAKVKIQAQITQKRKDISDLNLQYDEMKKRYAELTGSALPAATATATAAATGPATTGKPAQQTAPAPAPAKK